ncbi:MAG: glycogen synthase [Chloroflexi bacterium]|nr:glycogen synthase [Chloroflexota bacterium]
MPPTINVLFLAAEAEPFVKVGGLADVAGSLPGALRRLEKPILDVRLALPLHTAIQAESATLYPATSFDLYRRGGSLPVQVFQLKRGGIPVYFISGGPLHAARTVYSTDLAADREKYAFFSLAALELARRLDWRVDILHANDWHTALSLYALKSRRSDPLLRRIRSVLTLHNLPYMGGEGLDVLSAYGLAPLEDESLPGWARSSPLPLGLWSADRIAAVSPTYAREILTPEFGCSLEGFLEGRGDRLAGILNGLDTSAFDPQTDPHLALHFDAASLENRPANKSALQAKLGLDQDPRLPLFGMVGRVDPQKGVDLALEALRRLPHRRWQAALLGSGVPELEAASRQLEADFPARARAVTRYDPALGRLIYGGSDIFLMPSRYEPCGLAQMIAMRYGSIPLARATGGLKDTIRDGATGFLVPEASLESLLSVTSRALDLYPEKGKWEAMQRAGMAEDFSWERPAQQYAALYQSLMEVV